MEQRMNKIDDGGPAFPRPYGKGLDPEGLPGDEISNSASPGMSLRDWFAGQAISGTLSNNEWNPDVINDPKRLARWSYVYADAMLAARKAGGVA